MAAVIVHLQVGLLDIVKHASGKIAIFGERRQNEVHVAGGDQVQPAPDHGGGEDQHLLPLNASKQVAALIHYKIITGGGWM